MKDRLAYIPAGDLEDYATAAERVVRLTHVRGFVLGLLLGAVVVAVSLSTGEHAPPWMLAHPRGWAALLGLLGALWTILHRRVVRVRRELAARRGDWFPDEAR